MSRTIGHKIAAKYGVICEPEFVQHRIHDDDKFLILGSDGLWNVRRVPAVAMKGLADVDAAAWLLACTPLQVLSSMDATAIVWDVLRSTAPGGSCMPPMPSTAATVSSTAVVDDTASMVRAVLSQSTLGRGASHLVCVASLIARSCLRCCVPFSCSSGVVMLRFYRLVCMWRLCCV